MKLKHAVLVILALIFGLLYADDKPQAPTPEFSTSEIPREDKKEEMLMAGFQVMDTMEHEAMMKVWNQFMEVVEKLPAEENTPYYGINFFTKDYNPENHTGYGYMACVPITSAENLPEGVIVRKIPAQKYIVFEHKGPLMYLEESFNYIFYKYLPQKKHTALYTDLLEVYDCRFDAESPESIIEIWVPVK